LVVTASSAIAEMKTVSLKVENMTCAACPFIVKKSLLKVKGVTEASVDFGQKIASVTFDDEKSSIPQLTTATSNAGYPSALQE
ncbi:MAG: mercury resistance system periplasmic binding protein MerP, partial [Motiliproteus sp.]|nr:mercury resistance system periplasmic binding protein MerP [Motiliproteus sp.]